jgi:elongation factor G
VDAEVLRAGIRRVTVANELVPVLCGSALRNRGVQQLLNAVVDFMPSPLDVPVMTGKSPKSGETETRPADDSAPASGLVFKIASEPYVGRMVFVRMYSGRVRKGSNLYNPRTHRRQRVSRILRLHADDREDVDNLFSGEIGALIGLKDVTTGDTLCVENAPVELERITFPAPVMFMAIEPKSRADKDSLDAALDALMNEDPSCIVRTDAETGQTVIGGMGELHLEVLKVRLLREYKVEAHTGKPMVAYYETVTGPGEGSHRFDREVGGKRQFAELAVRVEPAARGTGNTIEFDVRAAQVPDAFREAVRVGLQDGVMTGVVARYPVTDARITVAGGAFDEENSSDVAFRTAAVMAFRDAVLAAGPELLEPIMLLAIITPAEHMGDVLGDLNGRRGKVKEMLTRGSTQIVHASVPLAEMFGYATAVRSLSRGRASYTMEPELFEVVPGPIKQEIVNRWQ